MKKAQQAAMKKLEWLVGTWEGESWIETPSSGKSLSVSSENVQSKLDGLVLLIEGSHYRKIDGKPNAVSLEALAIVSYDTELSQYKFRSYTHEGLEGDFEALLIGNKFRWIIKMPEWTMRYTIELTKDGDWFEVGEVSVDGASWNKNFEMKLKKANQ